jgi:hypothetical protein
MAPVKHLYEKFNQIDVGDLKPEETSMGAALEELNHYGASSQSATPLKSITPTPKSVRPTPKALVQLELSKKKSPKK